ncbi:hypothetical protein ACKKBG_A03065 [Auxenochlorella protothecoides x Auxenochlorella symbiontica]
MPLYLGLDVGTSGTKALLYDPDKKQVLGRGSVAYGVQSSRAGEAEQDPAIWIEAVCTASRQALQGLPAAQVRGIGVSGQQHGMVVLDKDNMVLQPAKLWCDVTSAEEAEELSRVYGTTLVPSFTATKLLWLKRHEPDVFAQVATVLLPHNYINFWLTGEAVMEASDASGMGFLSENPRLWDWERVKAVDPRLCDCLPPLRSANEPAGRLQPDAAERLGLPAGIVVGPGGGDNAMAALGVGAVEEGTLVLSLGTSGTLFGPSMGLIEDPTGIICPFADATGAWLPLLCIINCAGVPEEVRQAHGLSHEEITELASREQPGCDGVTFLPFLGGERTPNWPHASGALLGLRVGSSRPGLVYRAALEGVTFLLAAGKERLRAHGLVPDELRVVGGGARNRLWRRIVADAFQLPLRFPLEPEAAALGGALQAAAIDRGQRVGKFVSSHGIALEEGATLPDPGVAGAYRAAMQRSRALGQALFGEGSPGKGAH